MSAAATKYLRVFLVENDEDTRRYFRMYLEDAGHAVREARSVAEALKEIPKVQCDVLISDVGLADGTGWDLLDQLQRQGLAHPLFAIATSGFGRNGDRARSAAAGFRHHLLKPLDLDNLDKILEEAGQEISSLHPGRPREAGRNGEPQMGASPPPREAFVRFGRGPVAGADRLRSRDPLQGLP